jgi:hypothetical protein
MGPSALNPDEPPPTNSRRRAHRAAHSSSLLPLPHVENLLQHYTFSNGSLTDVNNYVIDVIINYISSTLGEIPGTRNSRAQSDMW